MSLRWQSQILSENKYKRLDRGVNCLCTFVWCSDVVYIVIRFSSRGSSMRVLRALVMLLGVLMRRFQCCPNGYVRFYSFV